MALGLKSAWFLRLKLTKIYFLLHGFTRNLIIVMPGAQNAKDPDQLLTRIFLEAKSSLKFYDLLSAPILTGGNFYKISAFGKASYINGQMAASHIFLN